MSLSIIVALPFMIGAGCLYWSSLLDSEHAVLQLILQLVFLPFSLISVNLAASDVAIEYASDSTMILVLSQFVTYITWVMFGVGAYLFFMIGKRLFDTSKEWKLKRQKELYGD